MKASAVQEAILTIGMVVIGGILMATQIPGMINDIQSISSKESVIEKSKEVANLLSIATASPDEIKLVYSFPTEKSYDISIENGYVNVSSGDDWAASGTLAQLKFSKTNAQTLTIIKTIDGMKVE